MIICQELLKENKNYINEIKTPIMVLDLKHFQHHSDRERFGYAVEVLNVINSLTWLNKICSDLESSLIVKTGIYYEIIDCLLKKKDFEDLQLHTYFSNQHEVEQFLHIFSKVTDVDRNFDLPFEVDFILLGMDIEHYFSLDEEEKTDLQDEYMFLFSRAKKNEISIDEFISQSKQLVSLSAIATLETAF